MTPELTERLFWTYSAALAVQWVAGQTADGIRWLDQVVEAEAGGSPELRKALLGHVVDLAAALDFRTGPDDDCLEGGILRWDARLAGHLEQLGASGAEAAARVRSGAEDRMLLLRDQPELPLPPGAILAPDVVLFELWRGNTEDPPPWLRYLARAVWDGIRGDVQAAAANRDRLHAPALPFETAVAFAGLRKGDVTPTRLLGAFAPLGPAVARVTEIAGVDYSDISPIVLDDVVTFLVTRAFELHVVDPFRSMFDVRVVGGQAELMRLMGVRKSDHEQQVVEVFRRMQASVVGWDAGRHRGTPRPLVTLTERRASPGRPAVLVVGISPIWAPGLVHLLGDGVDKRLVPRPPRPSLAALRSPNLHPKGLELFRRMLIELTEHAVKLYENRPAPVDPFAIGAAVGLPRPKVEALLESWSGPAGPFARRGAGWTLANTPELEGAIALLREGGKIRADARKGGQSKGKRKGRKAPAPKS